MSAPITFLLLPHGDPERIGQTRASIEAEASDFRLTGLAGARVPRERLIEAGFDVVTEVAQLASATLVAPLRPGDTLEPGSLGPRLHTFREFPGAGISIAAHLLVGVDGEALRRVGPPPPGFDPDHLFLRPRVEPAAVLIRPGAMLDEHLALLSQPHGDTVVWSRIAHDGGYHLSGETAARVPLDAERHGTGEQVGVEALLAAVSSAPAGEQPGHSTLRRELLRRLYLEPHSTGPDSPDLARAFAGKLERPEDAAAVVGDLQWIAERQAEALRLERLRWHQGEVRPEDAPPFTVNEEIIEAQSRVTELGVALARLNNAVSRLHNQLYHRDAVIARLSGQTIDEVADQVGGPSKIAAGETA